jgi:hypothetical protein
MVAAVGSVVLARRRRGLEPEEGPETTLGPARPMYTGTMAEAAGVRPGFATQPEPERASKTTTSEGGW